jgi:hypothetical protein
LSTPKEISKTEYSQFLISAFLNFILIELRSVGRDIVFYMQGPKFKPQKGRILAPKLPDQKNNNPKFKFNNNENGNT